jgi:hypothetical protein
VNRKSLNRPDLMHLQFNQCRSGQRVVSEEKRQHPPSGRRLEPVERPVFFTQVGSERPASDNLSRVIDAAQQAIIIEVENLVTGVRWDIGREGHLQPGMCIFCTLLSFSNSPEANMLFRCSVMTLRSVSNSSDICFCVSQIVSRSSFTSRLTRAVRGAVENDLSRRATGLH